MMERKKETEMRRDRGEEGVREGEAKRERVIRREHETSAEGATAATAFRN